MNTLILIPALSYFRCTRLEVNQCQLEEFRSVGLAGDQARCQDPNITCITTEGNNRQLSLPGKDGQSFCMNVEDLPSEVLANRDYQYASFEERACCNMNSSPSASDPFEDGPVHDICVPNQKSMFSEPGFIAGMSISQQRIRNAKTSDGCT